MPIDYCSFDWWAQFQWPLEQIIAPSNIAPHWPLHIPLGFLLWFSGFLGLIPATLRVSTLRHWCWLYKNFHQLAWFKTSPKIDKVEGVCEYRRWEFGAVAIAWLRYWDLKGWPWLIRSADNERSEYFQLEAFLFHWYFSERNQREHLQHHWPCLDDNRFENNSMIAPRPNRSI